MKVCVSVQLIKIQIDLTETLNQQEHLFLEKSWNKLRKEIGINLFQWEFSHLKLLLEIGETGNLAQCFHSLAGCRDTKCKVSLFLQ